jgi:plasmid replication initiation protein
VSRREEDQLDLFVPFMADLALRDQREIMERPFFSLAKRKRLKPIAYVSPDTSTSVNVLPHPDFGMATIWDADILIWAGSTINALRKKAVNDVPRTLHFQPYDLLKTIGRATGGREYKLMREALDRLQSTVVKTNIRVKRGKKERTFSWIDTWTDLVDPDTGQSKGMTLTLSDWFYEGLLIDGSMLSIDPAYFSITGGRARWIYRVARKHAGGAGPEGFAIPLPTLFEKSGAEGPYDRFKFEMQQLALRNEIPGFTLAIEAGRGFPALRMIRRVGDAAAQPKQAAPARAEKTAQMHQPDQLSDKTISRIRKDFPGWDVYALKADFDAWIGNGGGRTPDDYQSAFYGFVRRTDARKRA